MLCFCGRRSVPICLDNRPNKPGFLEPVDPQERAAIQGLQSASVIRESDGAFSQTGPLTANKSSSFSAGWKTHFEAKSPK